jgi:hypothetical protein
MLDCKNLIHPFQEDPGVSQRQRVINELLSGDAKIDGRNLADLLDYFVQMSRHINYYSADLTVHDWQPFFKKSVPFTLAALIKYNSGSVTDKLTFYKKIFDKKPSSAGLQLTIHLLFHYVINPLNQWHLQLKGTGLPVEASLERAISDKLHIPLKNFIGYTNTCVKTFNIKAVDFKSIHDNEVWNLDVTDLFASADPVIAGIPTNRKKLIAMRNAVADLFPSFLEIIQIISTTAAGSMESSLIPLQEELRKNHPPHLAVLFAFLKLFQYLQGDLNIFTKKHLDFFYKQVLKLKPSEASPDNTHIIFEIQNHLSNYKLQKGLLVKDGKDTNKAEVLFSLDDEIVLTKAQITDKRTLFLNHNTVQNNTYLEGVYMAPKAAKADGLTKDFIEGGPQSFATLGSNFSKYTDPEDKFVKPYPTARLAFILASPVLLLREGTRTVTISIACKLKESTCREISELTGGSSSCCDGDDVTMPGSVSSKATLEFEPAITLHAAVIEKVTKSFYYISKDLISLAKKTGISTAVVEKLYQFLVKEKNPTDRQPCYCPVDEIQFEAVIEAALFEGAFTIQELGILNKTFKPRKPLNISFSGEKEWIQPTTTTINITPLVGSENWFTLEIIAVLEDGVPPITFYNQANLKEELSTTLPLVKIELDDKIKLDVDLNAGGAEDRCCLEKKLSGTSLTVSLYHYFRNVVVLDDDINKTTIHVRVCGLRNFIVQNDESVQDVNSPVYPFGTRPEVAGFDLVNPVKAGVEKNLVGPNFYIGSDEVLCKQWEDIFININWKDKPKDFNEYYKAYWVDPSDETVYGLNAEDFHINIAVLEEGKWEKETIHALTNPPPTPPGSTIANPTTGDSVRPLFKSDAPSTCVFKNPFEQTIFISKDYFTGLAPKYTLEESRFTRYNADTRNGFLRINLQNQDFLHKDYAFILARQMMALGKFPDGFLEGATYISNGNTVIVFESTAANLVLLDGLVNTLQTNAGQAKSDAQDVSNRAVAARLPGSDEDESISNAEFTTNPDLATPIQNTVNKTDETKTNADTIRTKLTEIKNNLKFFDNTGKLVDKLAVLIPNEPWTPVIKEISLDYTALAEVKDIDLVHLYPYENTYKQEELELQPSLLPTFCDEGNLFLGIKDLQPGSTLSVLFQLAEATADSESEREEVKWYGLDNNQWKRLRKGFEVLDDATDGLTVSGVVKFSLPANMTRENTVLPKGLHWIKASISKNSRAISECIGIHAQAARVTFTNGETNDKRRLADPLPAGSIAKLKNADAAVKKVSQLYESTNGRIPEAEGDFYPRVSELLKHKGRAIQKFDYERIVLQAFPQLYKVKCINHSFALNARQYYNDFPVAPGYVLLAVIPDLNQLKAAESFEPKAPLSLLEKVKDFVRQRISPFVRLQVMNPRYEKVHLCLKLKLYPGKDEVYYKEQVKQDLREFLAPWAVGVYDKLTFGQCISRSDIVRFLESLDYVDYLLELKMQHQDKNELSDPICPISPRSILIAGDIEVCIKQNDCEKWEEEDACKHEKILVSDYCKR